MLFQHDYEERVVASFVHQLQYEYCGCNRSVYIEFIALEHFGATHQETSPYSSHSCTGHDVFHSFISDNRKQNSVTTAVPIKRLIEILKKNGSGAVHSIVW